MALPIRSITAPLFGALLAVAGVPGAAWANDPPHPENHQNAGPRAAPGGQPHSAPAPQSRAQAPSGPAPSFGGRGYGGGAPGGQAANHPSRMDGPGGGQTWHGAAPANNGARGQVYGYSGNARPNYQGQPNQGQYNRGQYNRGQPDQGRASQGQAIQGQGYARPNYGQARNGQQNYGQHGYAGGGQQYGDNRYDRQSGGQRWNNGWRNDRRYDWSGWRREHSDLFHGQYYNPPYADYGYARLGIGAGIDAAFLDEQYWIDDPEYYHLPPAYGPYRWVRYYNDCLLIDLDNGQIADVLYNVFW